MQVKKNNKNKKIFFIIFIFIIIIGLIVFYKNQNTISNIIGLSEEASLDADYSEYEEIGQKAYISSVAITETETGVGPFDDETTTDSSNGDGSVTWTAGDDSSKDNNIVRSFDQITWTVESTLSLKDGASSDESYKGGVICIQASVPEELANLVEWDLDSMAWAENATLSDDGTELTAYYTMTTTNVTVPGKQDLVLVLQVYNAINGTEILPTFNVSLYGNDEGEETNLKGDEIYVSATPSYNIQIKRNSQMNYKGYFDLETGSEAEFLTDTSVYGRMQGYGITIQLYNTTVEKGLKGIELPSGEITFDIIFNEAIGATDVTNEESYMPILWDYIENIPYQSIGKNGRNFIWNNSLTNYAFACAPLNVRGNYDYNSCYNGGNWKIIQDESNLTLYHVTITNYEFNLNEFEFPTNNYRYETEKDNSDEYGENIGCFSAGYIQVIMQIPENIENTTSIYMKAEVSNLNAISESGNLTTKDMCNVDNMINNEITITPNGTYSQQIYWGSSLLDALKGVKVENSGVDGDASALINDKIHLQATFGISLTNEEDVYTANKYIKFDGEAFEPVDFLDEYYEVLEWYFLNTYGYSGNVDDGLTLLGYDNAIDYLNTFGYYKFYNNFIVQGSGTAEFRMWYTTKKDGSNWINQDEMNNANIEDMLLFENLEDIPDGYICVGEYFETTSGYLAVASGGNNDINISLKIKDTASIGNTYGVTQSTQMWVAELDRDKYSILYPENDYPTADYDSGNPSYIKTEYDEYGQIISGTHYGGIYYGNTMLVTNGSLSILEIAIDESGTEKINYDFSKNEYEATFEVTPNIAQNIYITESITGVTLKITVTLPVGLTYVGGSSNEEYGEPEITENTDGTTTLVWYIYNCTSGEEITPITYTAHIDEESANGTQYETTVVVSEYISDDETYKIGNSEVNNRTYTYDIQVINLSSYSFYKTTETPVIEVNGEVHYKITALNNTDNDVTDFQLLDILPYNGDGRGTNFNGTYTVSQIVITQTNTSTSSEITDNDLNLYVTADESVRSEVTAKDTDLGTTNIWSSTSSGMAIGEELTAYAVTGTLEARERLEVDIYLQTSGNEPYDLYKNSATAQTNAETEVMETSIITVQDVKRSIEGYVWYDENGDGVINDGEEYLSGVTVTLLNSDGTTAKDVSGNEITSTTTNESGYYEFENMVRGDYIVQFQSATEIKGVNYEFTSKEIGSNVEINSKVDSNGTTDTITTLNSVESPVITESYVNAGIKMTDAEITSTITKTGVVVENEEETAIATLSLDEDESDTNLENNSDTGKNSVENNISIANENGAENSLTENSIGNANETTTGNTTNNGNETIENISNTGNGVTTENNANTQLNETTENNVNTQSSATTNNESSNMTNQENETENNSTNNNETNSSGTESGSKENSVSENETNTNSSNSGSTTTANETTGQTTSSDAAESSFTYSLSTTALEEEEEDTNTLTKESQSMMYTINYTTKVEDYIGTATVTIVDTLPYELEDGYTYTVTLNGETVNVTAIYDEENKTLTWEIPIENIYTYETTDTTVIDGNINIEIILYLKYKDIDYEQDSLTNMVTGDIYLEETEQEKQVEDEATTNIDLNLIDIEVTKNWDDNNNSLGIRPSEISITLTATANGTIYSLDEITTTTITLNSTGDWSYTWEDLPKYDSSGNTINYEITENLSTEQQRIYTVNVEEDTTQTSKLLASYIITNTYVGNTEYEDIIVNKVWQGDTTKTQDGEGNEVEEVSSSRPNEVTVILSATANGESYDITGFTTELEVTLTENESWTYSWENLPKYTETGQEIEYSIQETSTFEEYYLNSITSDTTVDGEITYTVTNSKYGSIPLTKVDKTDTSTKLGGATFKLEKLLEENEEYVVDESFEAITCTTESDTQSDTFGTLTFENLEYGTYRITETIAPEGYNLSTDTLTVTVNSENVETSVTATDKKKTTLPVTGQNGVFYVIIAGMVLLIIGIKTGRIKIAKVDVAREKTYKPKH